MNSDSKTVRGLSIAIVVLAALGILGVIAGFALIAIFGVAVNDPTVIAEIQNELNGTAYSSGNYFDDDYIYLGGMDSGSILAMLNATVGFPHPCWCWACYASSCSLSRASSASRAAPNSDQVLEAVRLDDRRHRRLGAHLQRHNARAVHHRGGIRTR